MSFWTTFAFVRPQPPPVLRLSDLADFVEKIVATGVASIRPGSSLNVKLGKAIDEDDRPTFWDEPVNELVSTMREIEWHFGARGPTMIDALRKFAEGNNTPIYRAQVFCTLRSDISSALTIPADQNDRGWCPGDLGIILGPILAHDLTCEIQPQVGWIETGISGPGYLFPWTLKDVVARLEAISEVRRMMEVCRTTFPLPVNPVGDQIIELRRTVTQLWAYDDFERPWDWYWWPQETG